jgi:MerR HTH family regulatory protein
MSDNTVQIGQAAALFGLAPSTVRWWEKQGVLPPSHQAAGKRRYDRTDLRRIGLAYLCSVTGMMPLEQTAIVTSGSSPSGLRLTGSTNSAPGYRAPATIWSTCSHARRTTPPPTARTSTTS